MLDFDPDEDLISFADIDARRDPGHAGNQTFTHSIGDRTPEAGEVSFTKLGDDTQVFINDGVTITHYVVENIVPTVFVAGDNFFLSPPQRPSP